MNSCPQCGTKLEIKSKFCPSCEKSLQTSEETPKEKKVPTPYVFGLIGIVLSVAIALGLLSLGDFELYSFSLWFVFPIGGIVLGIISTSVYFWRIVKKGFKPSKHHYIIAAAMAMLTFFIIQFGEYRMTYVDEGKEINHQFNGDHISNYMDQDDNAFTFTYYVAYKLNNSNSSLMYRGMEISEIDSSAGYNLFSWILDLAGFLLGGLSSGLLLISGKTHCTACKRAYVKEHRLGELSLEKVIETQSGLVHTIESNNFPAFIEMINREDIFSNNEAEVHEETYVIKIGACPNCQHGYVIMRYYSKNSEGEYDENESKKIVIPITDAFALEAISYVSVA